MEKKITKNEILDMILEACADNDIIVGYCENEKALLANKAVKAKERAAKKKEIGNDLRDCIETILTNATAPMTREDVLAAIENADELELTVAKVGAQISQLVQLDRAHKTTVKVGDKSKVAYVIGAADAE
jgi:hypothetical protein